MPDSHFHFPKWAKWTMSFVILGIILAIIVPRLYSSFSPPASLPQPTPTQAPVPIGYNLTISVNPQGSGNTFPISGAYKSGTVVTLTASPSSGYQFERWSGDASGTTPSIKITMSSDKDIVANFSLKPDKEKVPFEGNTYLVVIEEMPWDEAKRHAESLGGHLVTIKDESENRFVADLAREKGVSKDFWIGLTDEAKEGEFIWITGESLSYTNWNPGEPSNRGVGGEEDYVEIGYQTIYSWNDSYKSDSQPSVVEFEGTPLPSTPTPLPDLVIEDITWSPTSPSAGETITFTMTIENQGDR
jgi:uncharacterized repeat protein (TIGR02543 family)